jgi:hypothetical protein
LVSSINNKERKEAQKNILLLCYYFRTKPRQRKEMV